MIIDRADQAKYGLPYFFLKFKSSDKGYKLKNKLYEVLVHGRQHGVLVYGRQHGVLVHGHQHGR